MNWYLLAVLSSVGLVMGGLSVKGLTHKIEIYLWIILGVFAALALAKNVQTRWFLHALLVGIAWGTLNSVIQSAFFDTYVVHNAEMVAGFKDRPTPIPTRYFFLVLGPVIAAVTGLALAGFTFLIRKLLEALG